MVSFRHGASTGGLSSVAASGAVITSYALVEQEIVMKTQFWLALVAAVDLANNVAKSAGS